jgi:biopolymer transport protein ExbD
LTDIDKYNFPITLIADKSLSLSEINKLKEQLRIVGYNKILYMLATTKYDNVNIITRYMPPLSESEILKYDANNFTFPSLLPPPPEPELSFIKEYGLVIESANGILSLNNKPIDKTELQKILKEKIKLDDKVILAYYIFEDSKYQDYINLLDIITNVYYDLRDEYLMSKYGIKFRGLWDDDNRYDEARKEIPMRNIELDSNDYKTIKYAL